MKAYQLHDSIPLGPFHNVVFAVFKGVVALPCECGKWNFIDNIVNVGVRNKEWHYFWWVNESGSEKYHALSTLKLCPAQVPRIMTFDFCVWIYYHFGLAFIFIYDIPHHIANKTESERKPRQTEGSNRLWVGCWVHRVDTKERRQQGLGYPFEHTPH